MNERPSDPATVALSLVMEHTSRFLINEGFLQLVNSQFFNNVKNKYFRALENFEDEKINLFFWLVYWNKTIDLRLKGITISH